MKNRILQRSLLSLVTLALFVLPLALPRAVDAQGGSGKNYFTIFSSAARATTTVTNVNLGGVQSTGLVGFLDATAQSGTSPTLDVVIYDSYSTSGPWSTLMTFTQITAATGNQVIAASRSPATYLKTIATVGGSSTPLYTFSLYVMAFGGPLIAVTTTQAGTASYTAWTLTGPNGSAITYGYNTELVTLATGAAVTDTTGNLLPANSVIDSVDGIVTTLITTAVSWGLGDPTTAARFTATNAGAVTLGTRLTGLAHWQGGISTDAAGPVQTSAAKVRITVNANPGAGACRVVVFYHQVTAPTS